MGNGLPEKELVNIFLKYFSRKFFTSIKKILILFLGRVRIEPVHNVTIDIFVTHTAADPDPSHGYNNSYYRVRQVQELMDSYVSKSDADIVILGGDFNAEPEETEGKNT